MNGTGYRVAKGLFCAMNSSELAKLRQDIDDELMMRHLEFRSKYQLNHWEVNQ